MPSVLPPLARPGVATGPVNRTGDVGAGAIRPRDDIPTGPRVRSRGQLARARLPLARAALSDCHLCAHHCGVDRLAGERGPCKAGSAARIFSAQVEVGDELELIPTFAIAFSGCDLRCDFCITNAPSWNPRAGARMASDEIAARAEAALGGGARTVMILGGEPTIHLPAALEIIAALPDEATLVWKTNAHASVEALSLLDGLVDVWLPDYKFGNDDCAQRLARVPDYTRVVRENLRWMSGRRTGRTPRPQRTGREAEFATRDESMPPERRRNAGQSPMASGPEPPGATHHGACLQRPETLVVRHLLMPGHVECCWQPIAEWLAEELPGVKVSLRDAFWPGGQAHRHPELNRDLLPQERNRAFEIARLHQLNLAP